MTVIFNFAKWGEVYDAKWKRVVKAMESRSASCERRTTEKKKREKKRKKEKKRVRSLIFLVIQLISWIENIYIIKGMVFGNKEINDVGYSNDFPSLWAYSGRNMTSKINISDHIYNLLYVERCGNTQSKWKVIYQLN